MNYTCSIQSITLLQYVSLYYIEYRYYRNVSIVIIKNKIDVLRYNILVFTILGSRKPFLLLSRSVFKSLKFELCGKYNNYNKSCDDKICVNLLSWSSLLQTFCSELKTLKLLGTC